jgi:PilZ domain
MHRLTGDELRFEIKAALMQLSHATLRDLGADEKRRLAALDVAADVIKARVERLAGAQPISGEADATDPARGRSPTLGASDVRGEISVGDAEAAAQKDRVSRRVVLTLEAQVRQSGGSFVSAPVLDLSTHGFRAETHFYLREGNDLWLRLPGLEARHARVAWVRGSLVGCSFEEPLHEAVLDLIIRKAGNG